MHLPSSPGPLKIASFSELIRSRPFVSSAESEWSGVSVEVFKVDRQHLPAAQFAADTVIVGLSGRAEIEHRSGAGPQRFNFQDGSGIGVFPRGFAFRTKFLNQCEFICIHLEPAIIGLAAEKLLRTSPVKLLPQLAIEDKPIRCLARAFLAELQNGCPGGRLFGEHLAVALVTYLVHRYSAAPPRYVDTSRGLPKYRLQRVLDHVRENLHAPVRVGQLARLVDMSPQNFANRFRHSMGLSPRHYILSQRIERAKTLLISGQLPIVEIGHEVGFSDQSYFTTAFRRITGMTPKKYRQQV